MNINNHHTQSNQDTKSNKKLTIGEITFITIMAVAMGVLWWLYTFIYDILAPMLQVFGLGSLLSGVWLMSGTFFAYIIRKPGSALLGEMISAIVEGVISQWGLSSLIYGLVQGLAVELIFLFFAYKNWRLSTILLAAFSSSVFGFLLNFIWLHYYKFKLVFNLLDLSSSAISGVLVAGFITKLLADKLAQTGALNQFNIAKDQYCYAKGQNNLQPPSCK